MPGIASVTAIALGFDGKLPSRGDFVGKGLPRSFLSPWRGWIDAALAASRSSLGEGWMGAWLEAPIWRFALPGGACGADAMLGLMMPSVDRVGRHYPLTVAAVFSGRRSAPAGDIWLDAVEGMALDALAHDWTPEALMDALAGTALPEAIAGSGLWWTAGGPRVPGTHLALAGLPAPPDFAGMIDAGGAG